MNFINLYFETLVGLPTWLTLIFAGLLGAIIGSFLNVVILRYDKKEKHEGGIYIGGRSHCPDCNYQLKVADLIPVLSWIYLKGRCRKCKKRISVQYPLVELGTAILFAALFHFSFQYTSYPTIGAVVFLWNAVVFSILIAIFVYDLRHKIIPNKWSYTFAILALVQTLWLMPFGELFGHMKNPEVILDLLAGPIFFLPFFCLWFFSGGRWIGLGDGKLVIGIGWFLGFVHGLSAIILAFWIGAVFALVIMGIEKLRIFHAEKFTKITGKTKDRKITMKTEIPFGPFLILGLLIQFFFPVDVLGVSIFFM